METNKELIAFRVHETEEGSVIGACDAELLGRTFREGIVKLELREEFYLGEEKTLEELIQLLESCFTANLVGEKIVAAVCEENPHFKSSVKSVEGVPHLHIFSL